MLELFESSRLLGQANTHYSMGCVAKKQNSFQEEKHRHSGDFKSRLIYFKINYLELKSLRNSKLALSSETLILQPSGVGCGANNPISVEL
jgi:hypothetical protein